MSSSGGLLNNPVLFGLIIGAIIIVAVALILYFLVFKVRINRALQNQKAKRADKADKYEKSTNMAAEAFKDRDAVAVKESNSGINRIISESKSRMKKTEKPEKVEKPVKVEAISQLDQLKKMRGEE